MTTYRHRPSRSIIVIILNLYMICTRNCLVIVYKYMLLDLKFHATIIQRTRMNLIVSSYAVVALVAAATLLHCVSPSSASCDHLWEESGVRDSQKTGYYIVGLKDDTTSEQFQSITSQAASLSVEKKVHGAVQTVVKAFTVKLSDQSLDIVSVNCLT